MIHLSFLGERARPNDFSLPVSPDSPEVFDLTHENIPPLPLIHWTTKGRTAKIVFEGLLSSGFAEEMGKPLKFTDHKQGSEAISVTDLEGYFREQNLIPERKIVQIAMGIGESDPAENLFYHKGEVCLLINPEISRIYGGVAASLPKEKAREKLITFLNEKTIQYGGGYLAEAIVPHRIAPREIVGIILTRQFEDADILAHLGDKRTGLDPTVPIDYFQIFEDEIHLLSAFCLDNEEIKSHILYLRQNGEKACALYLQLNTMISVFGTIDDEGSTVEYGVNLVKRPQILRELLKIWKDPKMDEYKEELFTLFDTKLLEALEENGIQTYIDLFKHLAAAHGIPLYDKTGSFI